MSFDRALDVTLPLELGYVNHPLDPGGATKDGITQATFDAWREAQDLPLLPVKQMRDEERRRIYEQEYWRTSAAKDLAHIQRPAMSVVTFDWAVNAGPVRGIVYAQAAVGTKVDGDWGSASNDAALLTDDLEGAARILRARAYHYRLRCGDLNARALLTAARVPEAIHRGKTRIWPSPNPTQRAFLRGWLRRLRHVARAVGVVVDPVYAQGSESSPLEG